VKSLFKITVLFFVFLGIYTGCDSLPAGLEDRLHPVLVSAEVLSTDNQKVYLYFDREMLEGLPSAPAGFTVVNNSVTNVVTNVKRGSYSLSIELIVENPITKLDEITVSYSGIPIITAAMGLELKVFANFSVSNKQSIPASLVYWNRFSSQADIVSPAVGGAGIWDKLTNEMTMVGGGRFGNGIEFLEPNHYLGQDYSMDSVYLPMDNITSQQGTVEFWVKPYWSSNIPDAATVRTFFSSAQYVPQKWYRGFYTNMAGVGLSWNDGNREFTAQLLQRDSAGTDAVWSIALTIGTNLISVSSNQWTHFAVVWDRAGVAGSGDTLRLYQDGELKGAITDAIPADVALAPYLSFGAQGQHNFGITTGENGYSSSYGVLDNLKVYNVAKTDFSDRNSE